MLHTLQRNKVLFIAVFLTVCVTCSSLSAFAAGDRGNHNRNGRSNHDRNGRSRSSYGHYYYRDGRWHNSGWFWGSFAAGLAIGTVVTSLPPYYETVYANGVPYYHYDRVYYRPYSRGYIVVSEPTSTIVTVPSNTTVVVSDVSQKKVMSGETITINIPNVNGGYTPVRLTKFKDGYIGPQGEYYQGHPTVGQLSVLYGQ